MLVLIGRDDGDDHYNDNDDVDAHNDEGDDEYNDDDDNDDDDDDKDV